MSPNSTLLTDIEHFMNDQALSASAFGVQAVRDPRFVFELRRGRAVTDYTMARVYSFMDAYVPGMPIIHPPRRIANSQAKCPNIPDADNISDDCLQEWRAHCASMRRFSAALLQALRQEHPLQCGILPPMNRASA